MPLFGVEHFVFGAPRTFAFLPPDLRDPQGILTLSSKDLRFQFIGKHPSRPVPVHGLRTLLLAFDEETRGLVFQDNTRGDLVDVLTSRSSGTHE